MSGTQMPLPNSMLGRKWSLFSLSVFTLSDSKLLTLLFERDLFHQPSLMPLSLA